MNGLGFCIFTYRHRFFFDILNLLNFSLSTMKVMYKSGVEIMNCQTLIRDLVNLAHSLQESRTC